MSANDLSQPLQDLCIDPTVVSINYADGKSAEVKVVNILEDLLVKSDARRDIVIVGEGNFTFSIALATLRKSSWDGIVSTRYEKESPKPQISDVKLKSIEYCVLQSKLDSTELKLSDKILAIIGLPSPPDGAWKFGIDATNLPEDLSVDRKVVWFQCPWIPLKDRHTRREIYDLILKFLQHVGDKQSENDYVLIGIVKLFPYVKEYLLDKLKLFGENPSGPVSEAYEFLGADSKLIKEIIRFGYKHKSVDASEIHEKLLDHHLTLVFKHK